MNDDPVDEDEVGDLRSDRMVTDNGLTIEATYTLDGVILRVWQYGEPEHMPYAESRVLTWVAQDPAPHCGPGPCRPPAVIRAPNAGAHRAHSNPMSANPGSPTRSTERHHPLEIYVGNLPYSATRQYLEDLLRPHVEVERINLVTDRETGQSKGFAFVTVRSSDADAVLQLDGTHFDGRALRINEARGRADRSNFAQGGRGPRFNRAH